jgi:hypothetical protein
LKYPWVKWFPADWLADDEVRKTTPAARGLWAEALNRMYNSESFELVGTPAELARQLRFSEAEFDAALSDLVRTNAACHSERNGLVTLRSRRLERLYNQRIGARLRKQLSRQSQASHKNVTSASVSVSDPGGGPGEGKSPPLKNLPSHLNTPRMVRQWQIWMNARRAHKKPKNWAVMFNEQIDWLTQFQEPAAFEVLSASIRNGWQGLFEPKNYGNRDSNGGRGAAVAHGENPRNVGVCKGPTDYGDAVRRKLAKEVAGEVAKTPIPPPATSGAGGKSV